MLAFNILKTDKNNKKILSRLQFRDFSEHFLDLDKNKTKILNDFKNMIFSKKVT